MAITAAQVKDLRDTTGAGMMDAKKALTATEGDMDAAVDWLRTKGLATAAKKSGRVAAEGLVGVAVEGGRGVAVEVNSETDFVAKNDEFQAMVGAIAAAALGVADVDALKAAEVNGKPVEALVTDNIAKIGENMTLRRMAAVEGDVVAAYVHNGAAPGVGKSGGLGVPQGGPVVRAARAAGASPAARRGFGALRLGVLGTLGGPVSTSTENPMVGTHLLERVPTLLDITGRYVALVLWPHPLSIDYSPPAVGLA